MPPRDANTLGSRIAAARKSRRLQQAELAGLACVSLDAIKSIEQGRREPSESVLESIAEALDLDPSRLREGRRSDSRIHAAIPALRAAVDAYDLPPDGPVRDLASLRRSTAELEAWRLASRYTSLTKVLPDRLTELNRAVQQFTGAECIEAARLLASVYRSADAVVYKYTYCDLSARTVELMRWAADRAEDPVLDATASYVRMETFFSSRQEEALATGLRMLQGAIDRAPSPGDQPTRAAVGALHMRAAVVAGRMRDEASARTHLAYAKELADSVQEGIYLGTAFGPSSFRVHEVAVAVELNDGPAVLAAAMEWKPPAELPAERRSHYYIDVARAQLWQNLCADALESLQVARRIAPQHVREHPQVRETLRSLVRSQRSEREALLALAEWAGAT
ncbi:MULTISPECIES: helix-turn-helix domain-containing protein [Streptacidiphilus]|uniref:Helix-turn-helix domain-containing protein n=1 Tax=Streptacidiphilus cavernicola TaxID=3342716 RepID=A0ABV6UT76_9ACTN|nr:helix-turn-helix transcriptional regulator [Streptacidiphilus jeojiense]